MTRNRLTAAIGSICSRTLLPAALRATRFAPSGSHLYSIHIWLHAWTDSTLFVDGTQRAIRLDLATINAAAAR
jgi:hypothetical protein